jgi:choline-sulfatase
MYGEPGTPRFKIMIRDHECKYVFLANGGREQLFSMRDDPQELHNRMADRPDLGRLMREMAVAACKVPGAADALDGNDLRTWPYQERKRNRIYQFDRSRGVTGFPAKPEDVLERYRGGRS